MYFISLAICTRLKSRSITSSGSNSSPSNILQILLIVFSPFTIKNTFPVGNSTLNVDFPISSWIVDSSCFNPESLPSFHPLQHIQSEHSEIHIFSSSSRSSGFDCATPHTLTKSNSTKHLYLSGSLHVQKQLL